MSGGLVMRIMACAVSVMLLASCGSDSPERAATGIYRLTMTTVTDDCTPRRLSGDAGPVAVVVEDEKVSATFFPYPESAARQMLDLERGRAVVVSVKYPDCTDGVVTYVYELLNDEGAVDVRVRSMFQGLATCSAEGDSVVAGRPEADCSAEVLHHYELQQTCESPCTMAQAGGPGSTVSCVCQ
jgi:hypothetical protein